MAGEWRRVLFRDLLLTTKDGDWGQDAPASGFAAHRVIRGTDFSHARLGDVSSIPLRYLPDATVKRRLLEPNDIVLETAGGSAGRPTGRSLLITPRLLASLCLPSTCASFARFLRVDTGKANPQYVYWYLQYLYQSDQMAIHQVQHTGVARFQYTRFAESHLVPLPPKDTQRAISRVLGTLDDKIELNRRMSETLEAMARALFKSWFVDFAPVRAKAERRDTGLPLPLADLFPDAFDHSAIGAIPVGWTVRPIGDAAEVTGGSTPSTKEPRYWDGGIHAWATPKDLSGLGSPVLLGTERRVTDAGLAQIGSGLRPAGTILLSSRAPIGYLAVAEIPVAVNQGFIAMTAYPGVSNLFLLFWARASHDQIVSRANGSTFLEISKAAFRPIPVVVPPANVMAAFDHLAQPLYRRLVRCVQESRTLAALRDALLPKLISGELRVKNAEIFVEAAT